MRSNLVLRHFLLTDGHALHYILNSVLLAERGKKNSNYSFYVNSYNTQHCEQYEVGVDSVESDRNKRIRYLNSF